MTDSIVVLTTVANEADAERMARDLLERQLAACVQVQAIRSWYRWKGEIANDPEFLLFIKTQAALYGDVERRIRELHSYEVPEIIALPIAAGSAAYLSWIVGETRGGN